MGMLLSLLVQWVLFGAVLLGLSKVLPGFRITRFGTALIVAAVYSLLHLVLFKILLILAFIPVLLTLGLFIFVINAAILWLTDKLIEGFEIDGILITLLAAVILTIANGVVRLALPF